MSKSKFSTSKKLHAAQGKSDIYRENESHKYLFPTKLAKPSLFCYKTRVQRYEATLPTLGWVYCPTAEK